MPVLCAKGRYRVGSYSLEKLPGNLNGLLLTIDFDDNRKVISRLKRTQ